MIQYAYPRLDINVTKGLNHLLKCPFCIHPKTGKICIPFNPKTVDRFNPLAVPTINQLIEEVNFYFCLSLSSMIISLVKFDRFGKVIAFPAKFSQIKQHLVLLVVIHQNYSEDMYFLGQQLRR